MSSYRIICEQKTKKDMQHQFTLLLYAVADKFGKTPLEHKEQQLSNVGYFAGYYDEETRKRVSKWLGAEHPIFGIFK